MVDAVQLWPLVTTTIEKSGVPVIAAYGPCQGGFIVNPQGFMDEGIPVIENLYVNFDGPAGLAVNNTTVALPPGTSIPIPPGFTGQVSVNAVTPGHRFGGIVIQPPPNFQPSTNPWPPTSPTTMVALGRMAAYLYQQYSDDDDVTAFVQGFNQLANQYVQWFATANLPIYTQLSGSLLDWIAQGLYGQQRPVLTFGVPVVEGPYNTFRFNQRRYNQLLKIAPPSYFPASDDIFQRVITWNFYKGDGKVFTVRWLKRRVARFLTGLNGGPGQTDTTYAISVTFGANNQININLQSTRRYVTGGALFNVPQFNRARFNSLQTRTVSIPVSPVAKFFKACMDSGVLQFPFQYTPVVNIN